MLGLWHWGSQLWGWNNQPEFRTRSICTGDGPVQKHNWLILLQVRYGIHMGGGGYGVSGWGHYDSWICIISHNDFVKNSSWDSEIYETVFSYDMSVSLS